MKTNKICVVQLLICVQFFTFPWTAACQASLCSLSPWVSSNSGPLSQWCHPTISSSVTTFSSCPQSFPESEAFPVSRLFNQVAKVLDLLCQRQSSQLIFRVDFLYNWPVWSSCSPSESHESSPTPQLESINSSVLSLLYGPNSLKLMTPGKIIALTIQTFMGRVTSLLFNMLSRFFNVYTYT